MLTIEEADKRGVKKTSRRADSHSSFRTVRDCLYTLIIFCAIFALMTEAYLNSQLHIRFGEYTSTISALIVFMNLMIGFVLALLSTSSSKT